MNDLRLLLQADKQRKIINLQFRQISNLQIMMPILAKFQNLQTLSLNGNRLQSLPPDLSMLQKLIQLDISNNLFKDVQDVIPSLKTLPNLSHLMYSVKNDEEQTLIKRQLPILQRLNKKPINSMAIISKKPKDRGQTMRLNQKDLEDIAIIYDDIRDVYRRNKYFVDKQLADQFDKGVDNIMGDLNSKLQSSSAEEEVNRSVVCCRYALIDLCFSKMITYFYRFDRNIAGIIQKIHDNIAQYFRSLNQILKTSMDRSKAQIANVALKKQQLYKTQIRRLKSIQQNHLTQINTLQSKNAQLLDRITKLSKNNILQTTINNIIQKKGRSPARNGTPTKAKSLSANAKEQIDAAEMAIRFNKTLTLHQLKEVMTQLYASKMRHNAICLDSGTPMQTLQTHMYTFLNQKYGLKHITVQWAMSIVNGIKKYGHDDAQVAAFGKMLRNQLEQQFVQQFKKTKFNVRVAARKFKGEDPQNVSNHQAQQILLICGYKRDAIDSMINRLNSDLGGLLSPAQLQQMVLDYVLRKHCEKIKGIITAFRQADSDQDGIINHDQLYVMVQKMNLKAQLDAEELSSSIDPFATNVITFSHLIEKLQKNPAFKEAFA